MTRRVSFANNQHYHVYNRGVDRRNIFIDDVDRKKFLQYFSTMNADQDGPFVRILCYSLMPNHFHFLFEQLRENGISLLMHRAGLSYAMYFNKRHGRGGRLYSSTFHAKFVETTEYLLHLSRYIHLNPLDLQQPGWQETALLDTKSADRFLREYPWSSYRCYLGITSCSIIDMGMLAEIFDGPIDYHQFLLSRLRLD